MFSVMFVCLSVSQSFCPWGSRFHITIIRHAFNLAIQGPLASSTGHGTSLYRDPKHGTLLYRDPPNSQPLWKWDPTVRGISVHLRDLPTSAYIWWLLKDVPGSYWDAFLLGKETQHSIICIRHYTGISIQSHSDNTTITVTLVSKVKTFKPKCLQKRQIFNSRRYSGMNTYQQWVLVTQYHYHLIILCKRW